MFFRLKALTTRRKRRKKRKAIAKRFALYTNAIKIITKIDFRKTYFKKTYRAALELPKL